jgi:hypothetical protein
MALNTLRTGDANLRLFASLRYNFERWMTQICVLTRAWFLAVNYTIVGVKKLVPPGWIFLKRKCDFTLN